ncbi:MAG: NAD(+)/NADH kinase [Oscillospiraceae bacterium]|nr:NAD(+)/NADH kinase [Oscillospiraceae bacterium]
MKIVIFPNLMKKDAYACTVSVCRLLISCKAEVYMDSAYQKMFHDLNLRFGNFNEIVKTADIAVAIGGDGTILKCAARMIGCETKLLGINTGRLGFMASVEKHELELLERLFTNDYTISNRMMLTAQMTDDDKVMEYHALNDVVVSGSYSKIADFDVYANNNLIGNYRADGVVFSTPTGSTAYSLSAGGPIIEPELECIEMNLICPHSLFTRPMIYTPDKILTLVNGSSENKICLCVDGNEPVVLKKGQKLRIKKSIYKIKLIDITGASFYDSLNKKLMQSLKGR